MWFASCGSLDEPKLGDGMDALPPPSTAALDSVSMQLATVTARLAATEKRVDLLEKQVSDLQTAKVNAFLWSKSDYVPYASPPGVPISRTDLSKLDIPGGPKKVAAFISVSAIDDKGASSPRFCMAYVSKVDGKDQPKLPVGMFGTTAPTVTEAKASSYVGTASSIEFAIENTAPCIYTAVVLQIGN